MVFCYLTHSVKKWALWCGHACSVSLRAGKAIAVQVSVSTFVEPCAARATGAGVTSGTAPCGARAALPFCSCRVVDVPATVEISHSQNCSDPCEKKVREGRQMDDSGCLLSAQ